MTSARCSTAPSNAARSVIRARSTPRRSAYAAEWTQGDARAALNGLELAVCTGAREQRADPLGAQGLEL